ncbi:MAG TPA: hypothetical protein VHO84_07290 [Syntrophorhabdaceae bacterium]|nr:hypothetical protein [Syntrophorhabdaceae bacterium]
MNAVVFAYQDIGFVCLRELLSSGVHVSSLFTHDDDPSEEIWFRRPASLAQENNIPVYKPIALNEKKWVDTIREQEPDFIFFLLLSIYDSSRNPGYTTSNRP